MKNKNLRRLLALFLCLVMVLSLLTACGKKDDDDDDDKKTSQSEKDGEDDDKAGSTYTTPLDKDLAMKCPKTYADYEAARSTRTSGLVDEEINEMVNLLRKVGSFADEEAITEGIQDTVEGHSAEYGEDYEFYYEINSETKLDEDALKDMEEELHSNAEDALEEAENTDLEDIANDTGLSETGAEKYIKYGKAIYEKLAKAEISEGYELDVTYFVKGSKLDEPEELSTYTIEVYKINGCWVTLPVDNIY